MESLIKIRVWNDQLRLGYGPSINDITAAGLLFVGFQI
jgi:hypothetical protein